MSTATPTAPTLDQAPAPRRKRLSSRVIWRILLLGLVALFFLAPLLWMLTTSFKSSAEVVDPNLTFLPQDPSTSSFSSILNAPQTPVLQWFLNSLLAATGQTLLVLAVATMAAYALARLEFPFKKLLTALVLATLFVPPISLLIPNYVLVSQLGWLDSLTAVIVPGAAGAFGVFFLRQFFLSLPVELEEAAMLDGAAGGAPSGPSSSRCPNRRWRPWRY